MKWFQDLKKMAQVYQYQPEYMFQDRLQVTKKKKKKKVISTLIKNSKPKLELVSLNKKLFFLFS